MGIFQLADKKDKSLGISFLRHTLFEIKNAHKRVFIRICDVTNYVFPDQ